jgi:glycerol-3-phosphate dehydrogenase (NAD(P)+)
MSLRIAVIGAGAFGTALAVHLSSRAQAAPQVALHVRDATYAAQLRRERCNARYLPGVDVPASVDIEAGLAGVPRADVVLAAVPAASLGAVVGELLARGVAAPLVFTAKGFVASASAPGHALIHAALEKRWPAPLAAISGPSFAIEVARGLPTAVAIAGTTPAVAQDVAAWLRADTLRVYPTDDLAGVEVGGAVKNVLAIAAGASDGLGFGHDARAALITRGLAETGRLSAALGGRRDTLMGLAGLGDLVLTCTGDLSRNRQVGLGLARGESLDTILQRLGHVAEGVGAAGAAHALAVHHGIDMPIVDAVYRVLVDGVTPARAVEDLLRREPRGERE